MLICGVDWVQAAAAPGKMDFAAMKRRELQALCKRHGLAAGGTNAALVASLTAALSVRTTAPNPLPKPLL